MMQSMIQKSKERTNARQKPKLLKASQTKRDEQDPTPPATAQKVSHQGAWSGYLLAGHMYLHGSHQLPPSHIDPLGSGSICLYVWIGNVDMCFLLMLMSLVLKQKIGTLSGNVNP